METIPFITSTDDTRKRQAFRKTGPSSDFRCNGHLQDTTIKTRHDALKQCSFLRPLKDSFRSCRSSKEIQEIPKHFCTFQRPKKKKTFLPWKSYRNWFCFFLAEHLPSYTFRWLSLCILKSNVYWTLTRKLQFARSLIFLHEMLQ